MQPLRILLVDDHILFRKGIAALLAGRSDFTVVGEASDGLEAIQRIQEVTPDIILMDIEMPHCNGLSAVKQIKKIMPEIDIIMLTVSDSDNDLFQAIKYGAKGYLLKDLEPHQLYAMLDGVRQGEAPISGVMAAKILQEFTESDTTPVPDENTEPLTEREIEVLQEVTTGASNKTISARLNITEHTVKIHLRSILQKLQLQNRVQAAVYAVREGLVA